MASPAPAATGGSIAPSLKRIVAQKFKHLVPDLQGLDDGAVFQAIREQFPSDLSDHALAQALDEQFPNTPTFGAVKVEQPLVVKPKPEGPPENPIIGTAKKIGGAIVHGIGDQFNALTHELPQGLVRFGEGDVALREAQAPLPKFAGASDQISEPERQLRIEEAKHAMGRGAVEAGGGAAPIAAALTGGLTAGGLEAMGAGKILTSAIATGSDFGAYDFLTALAEGDDPMTAAKRGAQSFAVGAGLGGVGRFGVNKVVQTLERGRMRRAARLVEAIPGLAPGRKASDTVLDSDVGRLMVDHRDLFEQFVNGQLTGDGLAQAITKRLGGESDPEAVRALAQRFDQNLPTLIGALGQASARDAEMGSRAAADIMEAQTAHRATRGGAEDYASANLRTFAGDRPVQGGPNGFVIEPQVGSPAPGAPGQPLLPAAGESTVPAAQPVFTGTGSAAPNPALLPPASPQTLDQAAYRQANEGFAADAAAKAAQAARDQQLAVPVPERPLLPPRPAGRVEGETKGVQQELGLPPGESPALPASSQVPEEVAQAAAPAAESAAAAPAKAASIAEGIKLTRQERSIVQGTETDARNTFKYQGRRVDPMDQLRANHPELAAKIEAARFGSEAAKTGIHPTLDAVEQAARARIAARKARLGAGQDIFGELGDHSLLAATHIIRQGANSKSIAALKRTLIDEFGPGIKPHLVAIVEKAKKLAGNIMNQFKQDAKFPTAERLLKLVHDGEYGGEWYKPAVEEFTKTFGPDTDQFLKFLAVTSRNTPVDRNVELALDAFKEWKMGEPFTNKFHLDALNHVAKGGMPKGPKVNPFYRALTGDPNAIVVDVWMLRLFGFKNETITPNKLRLVEAEVRKLSSATGLTPAQVQERLWKGFKLEQEGSGSDIAGFHDILARKTSVAKKIGVGLSELKDVDTGYTWNPDFSKYEGEDAIVGVLSHNHPVQNLHKPEATKLVRELREEAEPLLRKYPDLVKLGVFQIDKDTASLDINLAIPDRALAKRIAIAFGQHSYWDPQLGATAKTGLTGKVPNLSLGKAIRLLKKILNDTQPELL